MTIALLLIAGMALLYAGAEFLVRGSSSLAIRSGVPSLVVGLTIVAFGTSAPELVVSIKAGIGGMGDISVGNALGSNIFNIAVILAMASIISPAKVHLKVLRIDAPLMAGITLLTVLLLLDRRIGRIEGALMTTGLVFYTLMSVILGRKEQACFIEADPRANVSKPARPVFADIFFILSGLAALVFGSQMFVKGATGLARLLNISDAVIGLTIVAAGTSLPELATAIIAAIRHEDDILVGNIVGSNIFNMLGILGITGFITPITARNISNTDFVMVIITTLFLLPLMRSGFRITRTEGVILLVMYVAYLWLLWP